MKPEDLAPLTEAQKDGKTHLVADETGWRAVAYWSDDMWALGRHDEKNRPIEQIEFEPTHYDRRFTT